MHTVRVSVSEEVSLICCSYHHYQIQYAIGRSQSTAHPCPHSYNNGTIIVFSFPSESSHKITDYVSCSVCIATDLIL